MSVKPKILIIDDKASDPTHVRNIILKAESSSSESPFYYESIVPEKNYISEALTEIENFDLILIDFKFDQNTDPLFKSGGSLLSLIREHSKEIPIYLISVININSNRIGEFDYFIDDDTLARKGFLYDRTNDHIELQKIMSNKDIIGLHQKINVPKEKEDDFLSITPSRVRTIFSQGDSPEKEQNTEISLDYSPSLELFRWLTHEFLTNNGLLLDSVAAATYLGISSDFFNKREDEFNGAIYKGLFSSETQSRWWKELLEDLIIDLDTKDDFLSFNSFKEASVKLLNADNADVSRCAVCQEAFPDAIGYQISDEENKHPVHTRCTSADETKDYKLGFDILRIIPEDV